MSAATALAACQAFLDFSVDAEATKGPDGSPDGATGDANVGDGPAEGGPIGDPCAPSKGLQQDSPWPVVGRCVSRRAWSSRIGAQTPTLRWTADIDYAGNEPVLDREGNVYVPNEDTSHGVARVRVDGGPSWKSQSGNGQSCALGEDGTVYVAAGVAFYGVTALFQDGTRKWLLTTPVELDSNILVSDDGTIYTGSVAGQLLAVKPDGTERWQRQIGSNVGGIALAADGTIYASGGDLFIHALTPDGLQQWAFDVGGLATPMVGIDGTIYVTSADGNLYAISPAHVLSWKLGMGGTGLSAPALDPRGTVYVGSSDGKLHAVGIDGTPRWTYPSTGSMGTVGAPVVDAEGTIYFGTEQGEVHAVRTDGVKKWSTTVVGNARAAPAIGSDGTLYVVSTYPGPTDSVRSHVTAIGP